MVFSFLPFNPPSHYLSIISRHRHLISFLSNTPNPILSVSCPVSWVYAISTCGSLEYPWGATGEPYRPWLRNAAPPTSLSMSNLLFGKWPLRDLRISSVSTLYSHSPISKAQSRGNVGSTIFEEENRVTKSRIQHPRNKHKHTGMPNEEKL